MTRYLDLFFRFYSLYNSAMKLFYIGASGAIVYAIRRREPWRSSYKTNTEPNDVLGHWLLLVLPCVVLGLLLNEAAPLLALFGAKGGAAGGGGLSLAHFLYEACWAFSEYLEAVAILPQLVLMHKNQSAENITAWYIVSLCAYRALYVVNWVFRAYTERGYWQPISWVSGTVQTALYADFVYIFFTHRKNARGDLPLPS